MIRKHKPTSKSAGFTITEVVVSVAIFSIVVFSIMRFLSVGDTINGRRLWLSHATLLATNQADKIRQLENSLEIMGDTSYTESIDNKEFKIDRIRVHKPEDKFLDTAANLEFMIFVQRTVNTDTLVKFRVLQGMYAKNISSKK